MTAQELQRIALMLSNQTWTRHWLNLGDRHENVEMAIQCVDYLGNALVIPDLSAKGFTPRHEFGLSLVYTISRTNEDGAPFTSAIF